LRGPLSNINLVMIVDDDEPLRDALESILKAAGFNVGKFATAEAFLGSPERQRASCLILDVRLPGMSGIELQRKLRETGDAVPIVFITAHGDATIRELVMKAGAVGFLTKPVRRDALLAEIRSAVAMTAG
jgi:FixJ family two-component response regulator